MTKKVIGIVLIVLSLYLGYLGISKFSNSSESVDVLGVEISAEDNQAQSTSYLYLGLAVVAFLGGIFLVQSKK